jgi:precorrin-6B methylase 1
MADQPKESKESVVFDELAPVDENLINKLLERAKESKMSNLRIIFITTKKQTVLF